VKDRTDKEMQAEAKRLTDHIARLFTLRDLAGDAETRKAYDYNLVVYTDQLMRLFPGGHNQWPAGVTLHTEVAAWVSKNELRVAAPAPVLPPESAGYGPKYPMPRKPTPTKPVTLAPHLKDTGVPPVTPTAAQKPVVSTTLVDRAVTLLRDDKQ